MAFDRNITRFAWDVCGLPQRVPAIVLGLAIAAVAAHGMPTPFSTFLTENLNIVTVGHDASGNVGTRIRAPFLDTQPTSSPRDSIRTPRRSIILYSCPPAQASARWVQRRSTLRGTRLSLGVPVRLIFPLPAAAPFAVDSVFPSWLS